MGRTFREAALAVVAGIGLATAGLAAPAAAQERGSDAEMLRRLDIMLMVTALRCRMGEDDFQAQYNRFAANHLATLNQASQELQHSYVQRHGARAGRRHLDTISTTMANRYGLGHPWLGCADLGAVAGQLAQSGRRQDLLAAAGELLAEAPPQRSTLVARYVP